METSDTVNAVNDDIRSPVKKCQGSSKTSSRQNASTRQVSPSKEGQMTASSARATTFLENFDYQHSRVILELAVVLKK
jgi:hypothetical protein